MVDSEKKVDDVQNSNIIESLLLGKNLTKVEVKKRKFSNFLTERKE